MKNFLCKEKLPSCDLLIEAGWFMSQLCQLFQADPSNYLLTKMEEFKDKKKSCNINIAYFSYLTLDYWQSAAI